MALKGSFDVADSFCAWMDSHSPDADAVGIMRAGSSEDVLASSVALRRSPFQVILSCLYALFGNDDLSALNLSGGSVPQFVDHPPWEASAAPVNNWPPGLAAEARTGPEGRQAALRYGMERLESAIVEAESRAGNVLILFTDGSVHPARDERGRRLSGLGLVVMSPAQVRQNGASALASWNMSAGLDNSSYRTELLAIHVGVRLVQRTYAFSTLIVASDCQSALSAIRSSSPAEGLAHACVANIDSINNDASNCCVVSVWVPGHVGIQGNELADWCAKRAVSRAAGEAVPMDARTVDSVLSDDLRAIGHSVSEARKIGKAVLRCIVQSWWQSETVGSHILGASSWLQARRIIPVWGEIPADLDSLPRWQASLWARLVLGVGKSLKATYSSSGPSGWAVCSERFSSGSGVLTCGRCFSGLRVVPMDYCHDSMLHRLLYCRSDSLLQHRLVMFEEVCLLVDAETSSQWFDFDVRLRAILGQVLVSLLPTMLVCYLRSSSSSTCQA